MTLVRKIIVNTFIVYTVESRYSGLNFIGPLNLQQAST